MLDRIGVVSQEIRPGELSSLFLVYIPRLIIMYCLRERRCGSAFQSDGCIKTFNTYVIVVVLEERLETSSSTLVLNACEIHSGPL